MNDPHRLTELAPEPIDIQALLDEPVPSDRPSAEIENVDTEIDAVHGEEIDDAPRFDPACSFKPYLGDLDRLRAYAHAKGKTLAQLLRDTVRNLIESEEG